MCVYIYSQVDQHVRYADMYEVVDDWNCTLKQTNDGQNKDNYYKIQLLKQKSTVDSYNVWIWWGHEVSVVHQFKLVVISIHNNDVSETALSGTCESGQWRTPACVI